MSYKTIDTIETVTTDKGTYGVHTDCYNYIVNKTQKELLRKYILKWSKELEINKPSKVFECHYKTFINELELKLKKLNK